MGSDEVNGDTLIEKTAGSLKVVRLSKKHFSHRGNASIGERGAAQCSDSVSGLDITAASVRMGDGADGAVRRLCTRWRTYVKVVKWRT